MPVSFHVSVLQHPTLGHFCGYVHLPKGHRFHGVDYDDIKISVHGGWTFSDLDVEGNWMIGFDTAHLGDDDDSWTEEDVREELARVVKELY